MEVVGPVDVVVPVDVLVTVLVGVEVTLVDVTPVGVASGVHGVGAQATRSSSVPHLATPARCVAAWTAARLPPGRSA